VTAEHGAAVTTSRRQALFGAATILLAGCSEPTRASDPADNYLGTYMLYRYGNGGKRLRAANAMSALGALAGAFAQIQARAMLTAGTLPASRRLLVEVQTTDGQTFYYGDAINACVLEGDEKHPSLWNYIAAAAKDPRIADKVNLGEMAEHVARTVGTPEFGKPRFGAAFNLTETPLEAVQTHGAQLRSKFRELEVPDTEFVSLFGRVGQALAGFAAGEQGIEPDVKLPREAGIRLFMEAAVPMSKLQLSRVGL